MGLSDEGVVVVRAASVAEGAGVGDGFDCSSRSQCVVRSCM